MTKNQDKSKNVTRLVLTCDLGGSQTKAIAQIYPDGIPIVLAMSPEVADVSQGSIERLIQQNQFFHGNNAWVGLGEEYYVLGELAKTMFAGTAAIRDLKYQYALPKIMAMLWLACRNFNLNSFSEVFVQLLLPPGEVSDGEQLAIELAQALKKGVTTPTVRLKGKLRNFDVSREGSGIMAYYRRSIQNKYFQNNIGMLMLGYRNASFYLSQKGNPSLAESTQWGMSWVVAQFVERTAVGLSKYDSRLIPALLAAGKGDFDDLRALSRKTTESGIESDLKLFQKLLPDVRDEYCLAVLRWMRNIADLDEIVICGGTAEFVRQELTEHFENEGIPIVWNGNVSIPKKLDTLDLGDRVTDVWTSHISHIKMLDKNLGHDRQGKTLVPTDNQPTYYNGKIPEDVWIQQGFMPMHEGV
ncbi:ParM/StbA family protein [Nodularia sp. LEGE 04288]|uniref:ParM/StbA family protein n=1 Tax=Nodularia sp. LEGE 04288 TaxID=1828639 RepID=UPI001D0FF2BD|nr:ParM/StbA family protein [Nodularia sp. LEGE 04288]MCC2692830.1 ParM/StbA family protein [Nodularia sp. LEGE 04288]